MKRLLPVLTLLLPLLSLSAAFGQETSEESGYEVYNKHQRSALYTIMLEQGKKSQAKYADEIKTVFLTLETHDKFDNHDIENEKIIKLDSDDKDEIEESIASFLEANDVAKKLVAKWYNRNVDGSFNMELIKERGYYNADELAKMRAATTTRGVAALADSGEELIQNTFILVNDIRYFDKEEAGRIAMAIFSGIAGAANVYAAATNNSSQKEIASATGSIAQLGAVLSDILAKGFDVKITSYLYKLDWDKERAVKFYEDLYTETGDDAKREAFENSQGMFTLSYVGNQQIKAGVQSTKFSAKTGEELIRKTLYKALDKSIVELQRSHEVFKSKTPVASVDGKIVTALIGIKEGVDPKFKYHIYERLFNPQTGAIKYRQVCVTKPVKNRIWDNTYMAENDSQHGNIEIKATEFQIVSGSQPQLGMLIHEGPIPNSEIKNIAKANEKAKKESKDKGEKIEE